MGWIELWICYVVGALIVFYTIWAMTIILASYATGPAREALKMLNYAMWQRHWKLMSILKMLRIK